MKCKEWYSLADSRDMRDSRELWKEIFPEDSDAFLDYYENWKMKDNLLETRRRTGRLVSMIHWNPYELRFRKDSCESVYIVAVATLPEFRHQGMMTGQLRDGMRRFREEGMPFFFLMPADPAIYEPFGFRYIYDRAVLDLPGEISLPREAEDLPEIRPVEPAEREAVGRFLNERLAEDFDVFSERTGELMMRTAWECRSEGGALETLRDGEDVIGVFSWWGEEPVEIRELVLRRDWESGEKGQRVLQALCRRFPEEKISAVTTGWTGEKQPIIMARILHVEEFLKRFTSQEGLCLRLAVTDRLIPENNGVYRWKLGTEESFVEKIGADSGEEDSDISIDIADLMTWLSGQRAIEDCESAVFREVGAAFARKVPVLRGVFLPEIV